MLASPALPSFSLEMLSDFSASSPTGQLYRATASVFGSDSAAECLRIAQNTKDEDQKARLLEMAEAWQRDGLNETSNLRSKRSRGLRANSVT